MGDVPADPCGQRTVLIEVIHGGEVPPGTVAAGHFGHARSEVDAEPFPAKQKQTGTRGWIGAAEAGPESRRREKQAKESGFEEHSVRLIAGEILRGADKGDKANE